MNEEKSAFIGVVIIWAAVILGSALVLKGTSCSSDMMSILAGGAAGSIIVMATLFSRDNAEE
ncbi:MAG: hypothetical protein ACLFS3_01470 [Candidatus Aenigmatarchaeota archaeon]